MRADRSLVRHLRPDEMAGLVVFTSVRIPSLLRLLRPGFQHCFVVLRAGDRFVRIDSLLNTMHAELLTRQGLDWQLRLWRAGGATILVLPEGMPRPVLPRRLGVPVFTCVESVKRLLGLDDRRVWLPSQLARAVMWHHAVNMGFMMPDRRSCQIFFNCIKKVLDGPRHAR